MTQGRCFILFCALLFVTSCASRPQVQSWQLSQGLPDVKALLVMDISLQAKGLMSSEHECKIQARYEDGTEMSLTIRPGERRYFWAVPQGLYEIKHMSCGLFTEFDLSGFPSFRAKNGRSYYFGQLELEIKDKESLSWSQPTLDKDELLVQFLSLPNSLSPHLFSPYSAKKISESLIRSTLLEPRVQVDEAPELAEKVRSDWPLRECQKQEKKRNPLQAGRYTFKVMAKEGHKIVESSESSDHLYTTEFEDCAKKSLSKWLGEQALDNFQMEVWL